MCSSTRCPRRSARSSQPSTAAAAPAAASRSTPERRPALDRRQTHKKGGPEALALGPPVLDPRSGPREVPGNGAERDTVREPMADKHVVRFEPVGIEIEVDEDQTILRGAFEQGVMLMHGCKEGQCSSCKSFVLDGDDIELERYSTFALPDYEKEEGYTLLCRAHAYEDLTIELLNFDEDMIRSGLPITEAVAEVVANEPVTHDMRHLVLKLIEPTEIKFFPGQYMDIKVPGHDATRSFSMANTSSRESG